MTKTSEMQQSMNKNNKIDFFLIFNNTNLTYFTGFSGATALLIPKQGESTLYVSAVNYEQAKAETNDLKVELLKRGENLMEKIAKPVASNKPCKIAVDSLAIEGWRALAKAVGGEEKLEPASNFIRELRIVKDQKEIQLIREACKLANIGVQTAAQIIRPGVKEKEVAAKVEYAMRKRGSDGTSFDTIIASGTSSSLSSWLLFGSNDSRRGFGGG